jgi:hypothetical protein
MQPQVREFLGDTKVLEPSTKRQKMSELHEKSIENY